VCHFYVNFGTFPKTIQQLMPVITLTTDWGYTDYFVGALKGEILMAVPEIQIIDISHNIAPFDLLKGAFIFRNAWHHFPQGTVHISGVSASADATSPLLALSHDGHYFVGSDNGFFSLVLGKSPDEAYYILDAKGNTVPASPKILAGSAAYLAKGGKIGEMGRKADAIMEKSLLQPVTEEKTIRGSVVYIDSYGNLVTNIEKELFDRIARNRSYDIVLKTRDYVISEISNGYYDAGKGNLLAHYNEAGYLEIAIGHGNAAGLLGMGYGDIVRIEFR
jgi:S-adenosyl-L-methionine hydrolase (adenosine-forming)